MQPTRYPYSTYLVQDVLRSICAEHGGIVRSLLYSPIKYADGLSIKSIVAQMPPYHKVLLGPHLELQYHLSGYGNYYEEAIIRLAGEAIERYSLLVAPYTLADKIRYATYDEIAQEGKVMPFEYLQLFSDADYEKLDRGEYKGIRRLHRDSVIGWVRCPSLFDRDIDIWTPAQMLFVGYKPSREHEEVPFSPGFSTGTASHTSLPKALQNAMLEFIEIDALMLGWYTDRKVPTVRIDDMKAASQFPELFGGDPLYEVRAYDLKVLEEVDAHVFGTALINKRRERPFISFGAQGQLDPVRAFYRSLMETVAISYLGIFGPLYMPDEYLVHREEETFTDLDRNVSFFATPDRAEEKLRILDEMEEGSRVLTTMPRYQTGDAPKDTAKLIRQLSKVSEYGVYLDVTPPETRDKGWYVMRVFFPELVSMCVPGVPYTQHPRIQAFGGIANPYPHPLP